ncbi:DUF1653 domain-containing protein [Candidatus Gracilibacteria bacterium]|nr:DUF1653 domain-containing protein [Candidatus Gracilibacteria bacterium]
MSTFKKGKYRNYKNNIYEVIDICLHTEQREKLVLYRACYDCGDLKYEYGEDPLFVRPYNMFFETVIVDGVEKPRFEYIGD